MTAAAPAPARESARAIGIAIGQLPLALRTTDTAYATMLERRYASFLCPADAAAGSLDVTLTPPAACPDDGEVAVVRQGAEWRLRRGDFTATWNPATRRGTLTQTANPYSTDAVIRIVHSLELAARDGFLLHAASVIRGGRAFLFAGVSGAGKTTLARLAPADTIHLTDEISYVQRIDGRYTAFGTPFAGDFGAPGAPAAAPVAALYFLAQGPAHRIRPLTPAAALRKLMRNMLFFATDATLSARVLQGACDCLAAVPAGELIFKPDGGVWELIA